MAKVLPFTILVMLFSIRTSFGQPASDSVRISIAICDTATAENVSIVVEIRNLSSEAKKMLKNSRIDYVRAPVKPLGNYIVELEKAEGERFVPFPPTADIDPAFQEEEYMQIKPNVRIIETIDLNGRIWSRKGFPEGLYRVRVAFNWDEWSSSLKNISGWITFSIGKNGRQSNYLYSSFFAFPGLY